MIKDTGRTEKILSLVKEARQLVRKDNDEGLSVDQVHAELLHVQEAYQSRLDDLKDWNVRQLLIKPIETEKLSQGKKHKHNVELAAA